jgi:hypothetical protein
MPCEGFGALEQVKQAAREELQSGHRMAKAIVVGDDKCWPRARVSSVEGGTA